VKVESAFREKVVKKAKEAGQKAPPFLPEFDRYAQLGGGQCFRVSFEADPLAKFRYTKREGPPPAIMPPAADSGAYRRIVSEIIRGAVPEQYRKRVEPVIAVVLECMED
jgi:hypothetical protein